MLTIGQVLLGLAFITTIASVGALLWGWRLGRDGEGVVNLGYLGTFASMGSLTLATLVLLAAFFKQDYGFMYVVENHSTDGSSLAWLYKISGVWAGREGSLLFWTWLIAVFGAYVAYKRLEETDALSTVALAVTNIVQTLFLYALIFSKSNNPFQPTPTDYLGPNKELLIQSGMNPLLQHWAMILHPPALFIGYAGLTIAFAYAMAALITNDSSKRWVELSDRITVFSWLFLGAGIGLGSVWAYVELSFGGFWAWDPVENASLLPWLTGVGLLHSFTVYRRRDGFKKWTVMLAAVTFALVILGTFITRSGLVQSVHAFSKDMISTVIFLSLIVGSLVAAAWGLYVRGASFAGNDEFQSLRSKEASYYFNNVIMLVSSLLVTYLTIASALPKWMPGGGMSFGQPVYYAVARPVGIIYVFIMAICPLLSWRKTEGEAFWRRATGPLVGAAVIGAALLANWWVNLLPVYQRTHASASLLQSVGYNGMAVVALLVAAFAIAVSVGLFVQGARKRSEAKGEDFLTALFRIFTKARTQSGGYLVHLGVGIILIGLVGSTMYVDEYPLTFKDKAGDAKQLQEYTVTYQGFETVEKPTQDPSVKDKITELKFDVASGGVTRARLIPNLAEYAQQGQTTTRADVYSTPLEDVFISFQGGKDGNLSVNVKVNPLVNFAWAGFMILLIGAALAAWPSRRQLVEVASAPASKRAKH